MSDALRIAWRGLAARLSLEASEVGESLIAAYGESHRRYHGLSHLSWLLEEAARRAPLVEDKALIEAAIWFHDAVYQPLAADNEEKSAAWAERVLSSTPLAADVGRLVRKTKDHLTGEASSDEALFLDMDMAILGAASDTYARYARDIRAEYAAAPAAAYRAGRSAFLKAFTARDRLFRTDIYEAELSAQARRNAAWELAELEAGRIA